MMLWQFCIFWKDMQNNNMYGHSWQSSTWVKRDNKREGLQFQVLKIYCKTFLLWALAPHSIYICLMSVDTVKQCNPLTALIWLVGWEFLVFCFSILNNYSPILPLFRLRKQKGMLQIWRAPWENEWSSLILIDRSCHVMTSCHVRKY